MNDGCRLLRGAIIGGDLDVVYEDVGKVDRSGKLVRQAHVAVNNELEVMRAGLEVDGRGEGAFVLAWSTGGIRISNARTCRVS